MPNYDIKGLDLKIDNSIHEICKTSNETAGSTRSVLYILLLINILAIIAVLNSYESKYASNWTKIRIDNNVQAISDIFENLQDTSPNKSFYDSIIPYFNLEINKKRLENNLKNEMENVHLVHIPVLGNQFDINDLGLIGGISIIILMIITRFTLTREANNLKIALKAISDRYFDDANEEEFFTYLQSEEKIRKDSFNKKEAMEAINYTRRQHHYNFLSMNEIFNSPPLEIISQKSEFKTIEKIIMKMFWFPFFVYTLICINDFSTISGGLKLSYFNTIMLIVFEIIFLFIIFICSKQCTSLKKNILDLFTNFKDNSYKYT